jgi:hypothetical protein
MACNRRYMAPQHLGVWALDVNRRPGAEIA